MGNGVHPAHVPKQTLPQPLPTLETFWDMRTTKSPSTLHFATLLYEHFLSTGCMNRYYNHFEKFNNNFKINNMVLGPTKIPAWLSHQKLVNDVVNDPEEESSVGFRSYDMSKAFYTVGHRLLLIKHFLIMVEKNPSIVIMSYLSNRTQFVYESGTLSKDRLVFLAYPKGRSLDPYFWLLFQINILYLVDWTILGISLCASASDIEHDKFNLF